MKEDSDFYRDFYVGYRDDNPPDQGVFTRNVAVFLVIMGLGTAALIAWVMAPFDPGVFEFGDKRTLHGIAFSDPQPRLQLSEALPRPPEVRSGPPYTEVLLVATGKRGVRTTVDEFHRQAVTATGTLIARDGHAMLELSEPLAKASGMPPRGAQLEVLDSRRDQTVQLVGEIVDSKCFLGVMKPGRGKSHRSCAALCIEGGIPPAFLVRSGHESPSTDPNHSPYPEEWIALLLDQDGQPLQNLRALIGLPVRLTGTLRTNANDQTPRLLVARDQIQPLG